MNLYSIFLVKFMFYFYVIFDFYFFLVNFFYIYIIFKNLKLDKFLFYDMACIQFCFHKVFFIQSIKLYYLKQNEGCTLVYIDFVPSKFGALRFSINSPSSCDDCQSISKDIITLMVLIKVIFKKIANNAYLILNLMKIY